MVDEFVGFPDLPPVVFAYQGTAEDGPMFFDRHDPTSVGVADPDGELYAAFEVPRGGWREMFGLRSWIAGIRATAQGHLVNRKLGDPWTLPTVVALRGDRVVARFVGEHAGDHPDMSTLLDQLDRATEVIG